MREMAILNGMEEPAAAPVPVAAPVLRGRPHARGVPHHPHHPVHPGRGAPVPRIASIPRARGPPLGHVSVSAARSAAGLGPSSPTVAHAAPRAAAAPGDPYAVCYFLFLYFVVLFFCAESLFSQYQIELRPLSVSTHFIIHSLVDPMQGLSRWLWHEIAIVKILHFKTLLKYYNVRQSCLCPHNMKPFSLTWELTEENKALPFFLGVEAFKFFLLFLLLKDRTGISHVWKSLEIYWTLLIFIEVTN